MPLLFQRPLFRRARILFRWCRISVWLLILAAIAGISYLHMIGLPDFLKGPLLRRVEAEGISAEFSSMQLGWRRGPSVIVENPTFRRYHELLSPVLSAQRAELEVSWRALLHSQLEVTSLDVAAAKLELPVSEKRGDSLELNNVTFNLQFFTNDVARLDRCSGTFRGVKLDVIGRVNHLSELRHWKFPLGGGVATETFQERLRDVSDVLQKIHFDGRPVLQVESGLDGLDTNSFHAEMEFLAPGIETPWGTATNFYVQAACARLARHTNQTFLQVEWAIPYLNSPWLRARQFAGHANFSGGLDNSFDANGQVSALNFSTLGSNRIAAAEGSWKGAFKLASSNLTVLSVSGKVELKDAKSTWGRASHLVLDGKASRTGDALPPDENEPWKPWAAWTADWTTEARDVVSPKLRFERATFSNRWRAPLLTIDQLHGELYDGKIDASGTLDAETREFKAKGKADFDPHAVSSLLPRDASEWLSQLAWTKSPRVDGELRLVLPPWKIRPPDWDVSVDKSLQIAGDFTTDTASFRNVPVDSSRGHVTYKDQAWHVSALHLVRTDGELDMDYTSGRDAYRYVIDSRMDPRAVVPLLPPAHQNVLDNVRFRQPPVAHAEIWGEWKGPETVGFVADIHATNIAAYGERVDYINCGLAFTNPVLTVTSLAVSSIPSHATVRQGVIDFATKTVNVSDAVATVDPALVKHVLRKNPPEFLNHVQFDFPPVVSAFGSFSYDDPDDMDVHFLVDGRDLHYDNFDANHVSGQVAWVGPNVSLTNISATLYGGSVDGWLLFDQKPDDVGEFRASFAVKDINLATMVRGMTGQTNHVEGRMDGSIYLTGPDSYDRKDWRGHGDVRVHDALLWDIKTFGLLSPVLNAISPGAGNSRARAASATFVIGQGKVTSEDLVIHSTAFRVNYKGSVNMDKQINARVEASLLRDMPVLGRMLSLVFTPFSKLFEYKVKGTLRDPVMEPVYVPRVIMDLLHPIQTIKRATSPKTTPSQNTNQPPPAALPQ